jgi:fibronectin-binding autotransporter adhesin
MRCLKLFILGLAFVALVSSAASAAVLTWRGTPSNSWTTTTSVQNWYNAPYYFTSGDIATFDDSGSNTSVNLTEALTWASGTTGGSVIVNSGKNYTFSGVGSLNGGVSTSVFLTKDGTGKLTITTTNNYTGYTVVNNGTLSLTGGGKLYNTSAPTPGTGGYYAVNINSGAAVEFEDWATGGSFGALSEPIDFQIRGGTLRYVGTSTSDNTRGIMISTGGATLESATPGALWSISKGPTIPYFFLIHLATNPTDVLTLTGAGNGMIGKFISPSGGAIMGLNKSGTGTWTLTAAATSSDGVQYQNYFYRGATTINQGKLILDPFGIGGNPYFGVLYNTSSITINSGGTLQLNGSNAISGSYASAVLKPVTINGGTLDTQTGFHQISSLTLNGGLVTSGTPATPASGSLIINGDVSVTDNSTISAQYFNLNAGSRTFTVADGKTLNFTGTFFNGTNFIKSGNGTITLAASNPYTGSVTVNAGTLTLGASGSISSAAAIDVKSGATFDVSSVTGGWKFGASQQLAGSGAVVGSAADIAGSTVGIVPGGSGAAGTLAFGSNLALNSGSSDVIYFDLAQSTSGTSDLLTVAGNFNVNNPSKVGINISLLGATINSGTYPLITFGSLTGSLSNLNLTGYTGSSRQTLSLASAAHQISLSVVGNPANLTWKGDSSSNNWNINTTKNWMNAGTSATDVFINGDLVTFDATGSNSPNINITTAVQPGSVTFKNNSTKAYTFGGTGYISGSTGITLESANTVKVTLANTGANDFSGPITINGGTLEFGNGATAGAGVLPAGVAITDNAALSINNPSGDSLVVGNTISGTGNLQKNGSGAMTLTGSNSSFTGTVTVNGGQLIAGNAYALGVPTATSAITVNSGGTLDINGSDLGAHALRIQGAGYDGYGALVNNAAVAGASYFTTLTGNATVGGSELYYLAWTISGGGYDLTKAGANEVSLYWAGSTNLGNITINSGILTVAGNTTLGSTGAVTINSGGTLNLSNITATISKSVSANYGSTLQSSDTANAYAGPITLYGDLTVNTLTNLTLSGNIVGSDAFSGSLTKNGAGTLILTGLGNAWANGITINTGTLQVGDGGANGSLPADGTVSNNSTLVFNRSGSINVNGGISGGGNLYQNGSGTVTLSSANYYSGNTTITSGTLALGFSGSIPSSPVIDVKSGGTFNVAAVSGGFALYYGQTLTGSGAVTGNVTDVSTSIISPGDGIGTLTFNQNLTLAGGDNVSYQINGTSADLLKVNGNFNYSSGVTTINILTNRVVPGTVYTFANAAGTSGSLSNLSPDAGDTRYTFTPSLSSDSKKVLLTASGTNKSLIWNGSGPWDLKSSPSWNTSDVFYNADDVLFDDTSSTSTVSIDAAVRPASVTINKSTTFSLAGSGKITGEVGLTKTGTGTMYLYTANDYSGDTVIQNGTVVFRNTSAVYSGLTGNIIVQNGASLNLRLGFLGTDTTPITVPVKIAGAGYNNQGALFIGQAPVYPILTKLELTADATISTGSQSSWSIFNPTPGDPTTGYVKGNGYALTTAGVGTIYLYGLGDTGLGDISVNGGGLGVQGSTGLGVASKTLTVNTLSTLTLFDTGGYGALAKNLDLKSASSINSYGGVANSITGNVLLEGNVNFTGNGNIYYTSADLTLTGAVTGSGGITKLSNATLTLAGSQNYSGTTTILAGKLALSGTGTIGDVANGSTLELLDGNHTLGNVTGSSAATLVDAGASVTVTSIVQGSITLGAGATLTVAAIPGGPSSGSALLTPVPEPGTWALLLTAFFAIFAYARKRSRQIS